MNKLNFSSLILHFSLKSSTFAPAFGVIAGRKYREACYVALDDTAKSIKKKVKNGFNQSC